MIDVIQVARVTVRDEDGGTWSGNVLTTLHRSDSVIVACNLFGDFCCSDDLSSPGELIFTSEKGLKFTLTSDHVVDPTVSDLEQLCRWPTTVARRVVQRAINLLQSELDQPWVRI